MYRLMAVVLVLSLIFTGIPRVPLEGTTGPSLRPGPSQVSTLPAPSAAARPVASPASVSTLVLFNNSLVRGNLPAANGIHPLGLVSCAGKVFVADYATDQVSMLNTSTNSLLSAVHLSGSPYDLACGSNLGKVFVTEPGVHQLVALNDGTGAFVKNLSLPGLPHGILYAPLSETLYITDNLGGQILEVNASTFLLSGTLPTQAGPEGLDFGGAGLLVANSFSNSMTDTTLTNPPTSCSAAVGPFPFGVALVRPPPPQEPIAYVTDSGANTVSVVNLTSCRTQTNITVGQGPKGIAYDAQNGEAYVADSGSNRVSVIQVATNTVVATLRVGYVPVGVALSSSSGNVYVTDSVGNEVAVIDPSTNTMVKIVQVGAEPTGVTVSDPRGQVFTTDPGLDAVTVVNEANSSVASEMLVGSSPAGLACDPGNGECYVANTGSNNVSVFYEGNLTPVTQIPVGNAPLGVAYDPTNGYLYVTDSGSAEMSVISGGTNTVVGNLTVGAGPDGVAYDSHNNSLWVADSSVGKVSVIYLGGTPPLVQTLTLGGTPDAVAYDPSTGLTYVSDGSGRNVSVFNVQTTTQVMNLTVGSAPLGLSVDPSNSYLFVTSSLSDNVTVFNGSNRTIVATVPVGVEPLGVSVDPATDTAYVANQGSGTLSVLTMAAAVGVLSSVSVSPPSAQIPINGFVFLTATPVCVGGPCTSAVTYLWSLANRMGTLSATTGASVVFFASNAPGNETVYVNATLGKTTVAGPPVQVSLYIPPPLVTALNVTPASASLWYGGQRSFTAIPTCSPSPCPPQVTYQWSLTRPIGTLNQSSGSNVTFTAGTVSGSATLLVNATLSGSTLSAAPIPLSVSAPVPSVFSLNLTPPTAAISAGGNVTFRANPSCTFGPCPSTVAYSWFLNNSLGTLSSPAGSSNLFLAGPIRGVARVTVTATLGGGTATATALVSISGTNLLGVSIFPTSPTVPTGHSLSFQASPTCSPTPCPLAFLTYVWEVSGNVGLLNTTSGVDIRFTAGATAGTAVLVVTASLEGVAKNSTITILVQASGTSPTPAPRVSISLTGGDLLLLVIGVFLIGFFLLFVVYWMYYRKPRFPTKGSTPPKGGRP